MSTRRWGACSASPIALDKALALGHKPGTIGPAAHEVVQGATKPELLDRSWSKWPGHEVDASIDLLRQPLDTLHLGGEFLARGRSRAKRVEMESHRRHLLPHLIVNLSRDPLTFALLRGH